MSNVDKEFEKHIKRSVEHYESQLDIPDPDWDDLVRRMDAAAPSSSSGIAVKAGITAVAAVFVAAGVFYFTASDDTSSNSNQHIEQRDTPAEESSRDISSPEISEETGETTSTSQTEEDPSGERTSQSDRNETPDRPSGDEISRSEPDPADDSEHAESPDSGLTEKGSDRENTQSPAGENIYFKAASTEVCVGELVRFEPSHPVDDYFVISDEGRFPEHSVRFDDAGTKIVQIEYLVNGERYLSDKLEIRVNPLSRAVFSSDMRPVDGGRPQYEFTSNVGDNDEIKWLVNGEQIGKGTAVKTFFLKKGNYEVSRIATTAEGCTDTLEKNISVYNDYNLLAPDAFTPNGDGVNDTWIPVALKDPVYEFDLEIRDGNGTVVFKTSDPAKEWKGPNKDVSSTNVARSTYFWKAVVHYKGQTEQYGGTIRVLP